MSEPADRRMLEALVCPVTHAILTYDAERQELIRSALVFDDAGLSPQEAAIVESRLSAHRADPASAVSLEEMKSRLSARVDA